MTTTNPYELSERGGVEKQPEPPIRVKTLTEAEKLMKLEGYFTIPRDFWTFVKPSAHVRYITKTGDFRTGGFIAQNPCDCKPGGSKTEKRCFKLKNGFTRNSIEWLAAYEDVEFLYAKASGAELTLQQDLQKTATTLNGNIERLVAYSKKLERRVAELERRVAELEGVPR